MATSHRGLGACEPCNEGNTSNCGALQFGRRPHRQSHVCQSRPPFIAGARLIGSEPSSPPVYRPPSPLSSRERNSPRPRRLRLLNTRSTAIALTPNNGIVLNGLIVEVGGFNAADALRYPRGAAGQVPDVVRRSAADV